MDIQIFRVNVDFSEFNAASAQAEHKETSTNYLQVTSFINKEHQLHGRLMLTAAQNKNVLTH